MKQEEKKNSIRVIICRPGEEAQVTEIDETLEAMEEIIGGVMEEYTPFTGDDPREKDIVIICDQDGIMKKIPPCRAVRNEDGEVLNVIAGSFFICYGPLDSDSYESLPPELESKYLELFRYPELFYTTDDGLTSVKITPELKGKETDQSDF